MSGFYFLSEGTPTANSGHFEQHFAPPKGGPAKNIYTKSQG
jgi:hypothetical protein